MENTSTQNHWIVEPDAASVAHKAYQMIITAAEEAIKARGKFRIVLAGGTTPQQIYTMLSVANCDWQDWEIFLGDERCLPETSSERNSEMANQAWLNKIDIPANNIHFIPAELGPDLAAKKYAKTIKGKTPFDLVLLGMGEDGHTASLFPGHTHDENELVHAVYGAPKPPAERVSLSVSSLSNAKKVLMIITGAGKKDAVEEWKKGTPLPISEISALNTLTVILDKDASYS